MTAIPSPMPAPRRSDRPPPLENGDHLTRAEFERRFDAMPRLKKAELIDGVVYMGSPVRLGHHGKPDSDLSTWLGYYRVMTAGLLSANNTTIRLAPKSTVQPDIALFIASSRGGQSTINEDDYLSGPPELVVEVATSSVSFDMHLKKRVYQRHGVKEYIIYRVLDSAVDWFVLRDGKFVALEPNAEGVLQSECFPGLWLNTAALVQEDMAAVMKTLQEGLASPAHQLFADQLRQRQVTTAPVEPAPEREAPG
jgi:Uma2 family endonuclease